MEPTASPPEALTFRSRPAWIVVLLGLVAWQGWMTLNLFGPDRPWQRLLDEQPIVSGRHPLHLYHGLLGATALLGRGNASVFDPAFQAGYPKTPVFDSGSRPAELFLSLAGGVYQPAAYKIGLALCCCAVPLLLVGTARNLALAPGPACLSGAVGMVVWWGDPCRTMLEAGDLDLLLAVLAAVVHVGLLIRFHRAVGFTGWLLLLASSCLGWFAQPLVFTLLLVPLLLVYYHSVGVRHCLAWHLALLGGLAGGVALNSFWLVDWVEYWWLRVPLPIGQRLLTHRTLQTFWESPLWGGSADRALAMVLFVSGAAGIALYGLQRARPTARLLALGTGGLLLLALAGTAWEPLGRVGAPRLLVPALWFAVLPAVHVWQWLWTQLGVWTGSAWRGTVLTGLLLVAAGWTVFDDLRVLGQHCVSTVPLTIGLSAEQQTVLEVLRQRTTPEARILWEDCRPSETTSRWTALLPLWTGRAFLGGLDPEANLEHAYTSLVDEQLGGRVIADWSNAELETFARRYNLGWIVARSAATQARLETWCRAGAAERTAALVIDGQPGCLFTLRRPHSFILQGKGRWLSADHRHIILGDVQPENGRVVLSLHYQAGLRVDPRQVEVERDPDPLDPIPLIRLRMSGPVTRIILTWPMP